VGGKPVGSGKLNRGAERVLTYLAALKEETYMKCGKDRGLAMTGRMDEDGLAAMAVDCNLKQWQLLKVMKYVKFATGCRLSNVTMKQMNDKFASDMVIPETGEYEHETTNDKGTNVTEYVTYGYQSAVEVFKYVTAQLLMENDACATRVKRICVGFGGDHGKGAFRLTMRVLIWLNSGEVLKDNIGTSTVFCKTDSVEAVYRPTPPLLSAASTASQSAVAPPSERDPCALEDRLVSSAIDYSPPMKRQRTAGAPTFNSCGDYDVQG
jgi:hypothetical protein